MMTFDNPKQELDMIFQELKTGKTCYHDNVVRVKEYFLAKDKPMICIVIEFMKDGDLGGKLDKGLD